MTTYIFQPVTAYGEKRLPCPVCGKKVRRSRTFTQTVSPFNKNAAGEPASIAEIRAKLAEEVRLWREQPETHQNCRPTA